MNPPRRPARWGRRFHLPTPYAASLLALAAFAQSNTPGPQVVTFRSDVDGSDQPYALYLPHHLDRAKKYPLLIGLHREESNHVLDLPRFFGRGILGNEIAATAANRFPPLPEVEFIVACPLARGSMGFRGIAEKDVYDVLADVERRFPVDQDRVYLTGISMGGGGALWLGLTRPDVWAAIAPVCAEAPPGTEELAGNALTLPIELFHGEQDPLVPAESSRQWQKKFLELGVHAEYVEFPAVRHNAWDPAYRNAAVFDWFAKFKRERFPPRVRFLTSAYRYQSAYWVRLDRLTPGTPASIDARLLGPNRIQVGTKDLDGFTLSLAGLPGFSPTAPLEIHIDGALLRPKNRDAVSFVRTASGWTSGWAPIPSGAKRPGQEGPIAEAVAARHIYVYGTADAPAEEELRKRQAMAQLAAQWSTPRAHLDVTFAVKADKDVTAADMAEANLILFGGRQTNSLVARFAPHLPIELNPGAADYGLVFIAPLGNRYVVVNSGLAWWTGAAQVKRSGWRTTPAPFRVLETFGDYLLFKGTLEHVVAEGRFDGNWKLPPAAAERMLATGAVVISSCCQKSFENTPTK